MSTEYRTFVVDDDAAMRDSLTMLLEAAGHTVATFANARDFLDVCTRDTLGCAILDVDMPGMDGPTLQKELTRRGINLPVIFLSGHGTIPTTVHTIKAGALDFLTKPVDGSTLLARVQDALGRCATLHEQAEVQQSMESRLASLTEREREVMALTVQGKTSKEIAQQLAISYRTVEIHRAHIMHKTGAANLLELSRIASILNPPPAPL